MNQLETRVAVLERRLRNQRFLLGAMALCLVLLLGAGFRSPQSDAATRETAVFDRVEAGAFVLVRDDKERARLGFDGSNHRWPGLAIRNESGEEQIQLFLRGETPDLTFLNSEGRMRLNAYAHEGGPTGVSLHEDGAQVGGMFAGGTALEGRARFTARTASGWWTSPSE